jgi:hypothetical protein
VESARFLFLRYVKSTRGLDYCLFGLSCSAGCTTVVLTESGSLERPCSIRWPATPCLAARRCPNRGWGCTPVPVLGVSRQTTNHRMDSVQVFRTLSRCIIESALDLAAVPVASKWLHNPISGQGAREAKKATYAKKNFERWMRNRPSKRVRTPLAPTYKYNNYCVESRRECPVEALAIELAPANRDPSTESPARCQYCWSSDRSGGKVPEQQRKDLFQAARRQREAGSRVGPQMADGTVPSSSSSPPLSGSGASVWCLV